MMASLEINAYDLGGRFEMVSGRFPLSVKFLGGSRRIDSSLEALNVQQRLTQPLRVVAGAVEIIRCLVPLKFTVTRAVGSLR